MIGTYVVLLVVGACSAVPEPKVNAVHAPPYVQSNEQFTQAKYYVQSNLPLQPQDIHDPGQRQNLGFSVLAGVVNDLVTAADHADHKPYEPLLVLASSVPKSLQSYLEIATQAQQVVSDLDLKVKVVTDYMELACGSSSVQNCNALVQQKVDQYPAIFKPSADLLLDLGNVSKLVLDNQDTLQEVTKDHGEVSYLLHNVDAPHFQNFVDKLLKVTREERKLQTRRLLA